MKSILSGLCLAAALCAQTSPFPTSLDTVATLGVPADNVSSALTAQILIGDTVAQVANATNVPQWSLITFGAEVDQVCLVSGNTLTFGTPTSCPSISGRGLSGTTVAAHSLGTVGYLNVNGWYHRALASGVVAIEGSIPRMVSDMPYLTAGQTIYQACLEAAMAGLTLSVSGSWASVGTGPCAADLQYSKGGILHLAVDATFTQSGNIVAPPGQQLFDASASGSGVSLPNPLETVYTNWFGVNSAAFAAAISAIAGGSVGPNGVNLATTCGTYALTATLTFTSSTGLRYEGQAPGCVIFTPGASFASSALVQVQDCFACTFQNFTVLGNSSYGVLYGLLELNSGGSGVYTTSANVFKNVNINGVNITAPYIVNGFYMGTGTNANNDQAKLETVKVSDVSGAAFTTNNTNVYDISFDHCSSSFAQIGLNVLNGNVFWRDGEFGGSGVVDVRVQSFEGTVDIANFRSESAAKFLDNGNTALVPVNVWIHGLDWASNQLGCTEANIRAGSCSSPAGGDAITWTRPGSLHVSDSTIGGYSDTQTVHVNLTSNFLSTTRMIAAFDGVTFGGTSLTIAGVFDNAMPSTVTNSYNYDGNTGAIVNFPDFFNYALQVPALLTGAFASNNITGNMTTNAGGAASHSFTTPSPYTNSPSCVVSDTAAGTTATAAVATTASGLSITGGGNAHTWNYICVGFN